MKKFTKFSLATVAVLGLSSSAYAISVIELGAGGLTLPVGTADAISLNASGVGPVPAVPVNTVNIFAPAGTNISDDLTVGGTIYGGDYPAYNSLDLNYNTYNALLQAGDDIILNADSEGFGYGGVVLQKNGTTLARFDENADGGAQIYTDLDMDGNQIHNVGAGTLGTDAVNMNQLNAVENDMSGGIAAVTAIANIPQVDQGKTYSLGIGFGHYSGENAFAVGGSWRYNNDGILKASVGSGGSGATVGVGTAMSW